MEDLKRNTDYLWIVSEPWLRRIIVLNLKKIVGVWDIIIHFVLTGYVYMQIFLTQEYPLLGGFKSDMNLVYFTFTF